VKFVMAYSGGKDSALALYRMIADGHQPVALLTTANAEQERSWFHGIGRELLETVSDSLKIPLIYCYCTPGEYANALEGGLVKAREMGASACVFGDIDIDEHKYWNEERCRNTGLTCILPLWKQNREALVRETVELGFRAIIKIIQTDKLEASFLGQELSIPLIEKLKLTAADVCGENGEYHTFVYDGPIFRYPVEFKTGEIVDLGKYRAIELALGTEPAEREI